MRWSMNGFLCGRRTPGPSLHPAQRSPAQECGCSTFLPASGNRCRHARGGREGHPPTRTKINKNLFFFYYILFFCIHICMYIYNSRTQTYIHLVQVHPGDTRGGLFMNKGIIEAELLKIVKPFSKNKTPGRDGLPSEFCKMFWQAIKFCLLESYKYSYQTGNLNITQKRGILWLTPKKSDPLQLKNWRPLSLLNQDYETLSKLVPDWMKIALPKK